MTTRRERFEQLAAVLPDKHRDGIRYHLGAQRQVAEHARTVLQHPGWQVFVDHVDAQLEVLDARRTILQRQLEDGAELGEALTKIKLELTAIKAEIRGWAGAKTMIPQMIEAGDRAVEALAGLDASPRNGELK